ncbi:protein FLX-like 4 [Chenopodium quinoa]|uniref:protein FLX-like 4 n=1 Tax=Chenopodium quinoa TaxID=63459 RepID=UPI000B78B5CC|nr:protein FLX-like 4 [Chenopodium quinoa]XP_021731392.1 protein FLX-like 4 [Chenopodium quinoa]
MSGRGHLTMPGMMRHGQPPGNGTQIDEIDHLVMENKRLATSIAAMRQDRAMVEEEIRRIGAHIRSIETESDIQIRVLLEKIARMELGLKAGESVKKDLQQAHKDAQSLVAARQELTLKIKQASQDLDKWHTDIKRIPELLSKLDSMKLEHQRLRSAFEHEKHMNLDLVEHMQTKEKNLVSMDREVETLRAKILDVEKRVQEPYDSTHPNQDAQYPSLYQSNDLYYDPYRRAAIEGTVSHSNSGEPSPAVGAISHPHRHWVAYDPKFQSLPGNRD